MSKIVYYVDWRHVSLLTVCSAEVHFKMVDHENIVKQRLDLPLIRSNLSVFLRERSVTL